jgi:flagellar biosynthesis/type III secretory pathway protein FliH
LRSALPKKLLEQLQNRGFEVTKPDRGIYYIQKPEHFPAQIIAIKEVNEEEHVWLRGLTEHLEEENAKRLIYATRLLQQKGDVDNADAVLQVSMKANEAVYDKMKKEDIIVCEALRELMRPEIEQEFQQGMQQGIQQGMQQGIQKMLGVLQELNQSTDTAFAQLKDKYQLEGEAAEKYMKLYWKGYNALLENADISVFPLE